MAVSIEEKIKLLEECGMNVAANKIREEIEMKAEAEKLSALKLFPVTEKEIERKICGLYFDGNISDPNFFHAVTVVSGIGFIALGLDQIFSATLFLKPLLAVAIVLIVSAVLSCIRKSVLASMSLESWKDRIPYGALLAVKEAKERGISDFKIYYPVTEEKARLLKDPVIVGMSGVKYAEKLCERGYGRTLLSSLLYSGLEDACPKGSHTHREKISDGLMVEVFAWDDGKVYE